MTKKLALVAFAILLLAGAAFTVSTEMSGSSFAVKQKQEFEFKVGDLLFQTSKSAQSKAIQLATASKFSHVGMVVSVKGKLMIFEAVQPVKLTSIDEFIGRGISSQYALKRLKPEAGKFDAAATIKLESLLGKYLGKDYDIYFNWSDKEIYCSELVWKVYKEVLGVKLSSPNPLKSYNLEHPLVREQMKARYGANLPLDEVMVSPQDLYDSILLE
jgi:hypothetical protein